MQLTAAGQVAHNNHTTKIQTFQDYN